MSLKDKLAAAVAIKKDVDGYYQANIDRYRRFEAEVKDVMNTLNFSRLMFDVKDYGKFIASKEKVELPLSPKEFSEKMEKKFSEPLEAKIQEFVYNCKAIIGQCGK